LAEVAAAEAALLPAEGAAEEAVAEARRQQELQAEPYRRHHLRK
jgi:hypothetical protein